MDKVGRLEEFLAEAELQQFFLPDSEVGQDADDLISHAIESIRNMTLDSSVSLRQIHNLQEIIRESLASFGRFIFLY